MFEPKKSTEEELWKFSKFEKELTCALKNDRGIWQILTQHSKISKFAL